MDNRGRKGWGRIDWNALTREDWLDAAGTAVVILLLILGLALIT